MAKQRTNIDDFLNNLEQEKKPLLDFSNIRLTLFGKMLLASLVVAIVVGLLSVFDDSRKFIPAKDTAKVSTTEITIDSTKYVIAVMKDGDQAIVASHLISIMGDGYSSYKNENK